MRWLPDSRLGKPKEACAERSASMKRIANAMGKLYWGKWACTVWGTVRNDGDCPSRPDFHLGYPASVPKRVRGRQWTCRRADRTTWGGAATASCDPLSIRAICTATIEGGRMSNEKTGNAATASRALQPTEPNPLDFVPDKIPFDTPYGPPGVDSGVIEETSRLDEPYTPIPLEHLASSQIEGSR